eukprot:scaffold22753_cov160-Cylindrotheca_fusiformis.AAC.3
MKGAQCQAPTFNENDACGLWLAKSTVGDNGLGLFIGEDIAAGETVLRNGGEPHILLPDINLNVWSPLRDIIWDGSIVALDTLLQVDFSSHSFLPGVGAIAKCHDSLANVHLNPTEEVDSLGVHRSADPTSGSFTYRQHSEFVASTPLAAGQEIFVDCDQQKATRASSLSTEKRLHQSTLSDLKQNGICMDNLVVKPSTIPKAGRGAFSKRQVKAGETITASPVVAFDRSRLFLVAQETYDDDMMYYGEFIECDQLLTNYCYSDGDSNVVLLPTGPGVNYINHDASKTNAILKWSDSPLNGEKRFLNMTDTKITSGEHPVMILEYVALRDIQDGEEIFLDYGKDWVESFERFSMVEWAAPPFSSKYVSATEYQQQHPAMPIRTISEQREKKYPRNIETACLFVETELTNSEESVTWTDENERCLRPCRVLDRTIDSGGQHFYAAEVLPIPTVRGNRECKLSLAHKVVHDIPAKAVFLVDRPYTTDEHMPGTFRHSIAASSGVYPDNWLKDDTNDMGDFLQPELNPGQIEPIRWKNSEQIVSDNAYVLGLPYTIRESLLGYCDDAGITSYFRELTYRGNSWEYYGTEQKTFDALQWQVRGPTRQWNSDMHWISPYNAATHLGFLQELGIAGFDDVLKGVGEHFGMEGLAVYQMSFIAVSHCTEGVLHEDIAGSGGKVFNIIIPLLLAEDTGPELDVAENKNGGPVGRLRFRYDVAIMMGDNAFHATSAVDYRASREMRMAARIHVADMNAENIESIIQHYTQDYPESSTLPGMAGVHWKANDPSIRLPEYFPPEEAEEDEYEEDESSDE